MGKNKFKGVSSGDFFRECKRDLKAHRRLLLQKMQRKFQGFLQKGQTIIAAASKEIKMGVAEFVWDRGKKLQGFLGSAEGSCRGTVMRATESLLL